MSISSPVPLMASLPSLAALNRYTCTDPSLSEAWTLTRQLRRLEYTWEEADLWRRNSRALAAGIQRALTRHIVEAERDASLPRFLAESRDPVAMAQLAEHGDLAKAANALVRQCSAPIVADIWTVVEAAEKAIFLETLIARHASRLDQLARSSEVPGPKPPPLGMEPRL